MPLPKDSQARKMIPAFRAALAYFPDAIAGVAAHSAKANAKHNPGEPIHWARGKSTDEIDSIARHLLDVACGATEETIEINGETVAMNIEDSIAWRALAFSQRVKDAMAMGMSREEAFRCVIHGV